ncbi:MAG: DUF2835 domain-containing protein [Sedimenticola sp.]
MSERIRFHLAIPADSYLRYYRGDAQVVSAVSEDGRRVEFPATALRQFVSRDGIYGYFELVIDRNNKLVELLRLSGDG